MQLSGISWPGRVFSPVQTQPRPCHTKHSLSCSFCRCYSIVNTHWLLMDTLIIDRIHWLLIEYTDYWWIFPGCPTLRNFLLKYLILQVFVAYFTGTSSAAETTMGGLMNSTKHECECRAVYLECVLLDGSHVFVFFRHFSKGPITIIHGTWSSRPVLLRTSKYTGLSVLIHAECEASRALMPRRHVASEVYQKKVLQKVARFVIDIKLPLEMGDIYCLPA